MLEFDLSDLLDDKYDIDINEYWTLTEEDKDHLTDIMVANILLQLTIAPEYYSQYIEQLNKRIEYAGNYDQYERADMLNRMRKKLLEIKPL